MRLALYTAVTLPMFGYTLWRIMTEPIRPFDWWMLAIEALVLLFVGYEVSVTIVHQIQGKIRSKRLREIEKSLRSFLSSGIAIKNKVSRWTTTSTYDEEWVQSIKSWCIDVENYLDRQNSENAANEFRHVALLSQDQRQHLDDHGSIFHISGHMGDMFQLLSVRLENLHRIAQHCEDYF